MAKIIGEVAHILNYKQKKKPKIKKENKTNQQTLFKKNLNRKTMKNIYKRCKQNKMRACSGLRIDVFGRVFCGDVQGKIPIEHWIE